MSYREKLKARAGRSITNMAVIVRQIFSELARLNNLGQVTAGAAQRRGQRAAGLPSPHAPGRFCGISNSCSFIPPLLPAGWTRCR